MPEALGSAGRPARVLWMIILEEDASEGFAAAAVATTVVVPEPAGVPTAVVGMQMMVVVVVVVVVLAVEAAWPYFSSSILDWNTWRWYSILLISPLVAPVPARFLRLLLASFSDRTLEEPIAPEIEQELVEVCELARDSELTIVASKSNELALID